MKMVGGQWQRISWDTAINEIAFRNQLIQALLRQRARQPRVVLLANGEEPDGSAWEQLLELPNIRLVCGADDPSELVTSVRSLLSEEARRPAAEPTPS